MWPREAWRDRERERGMHRRRDQDIKQGSVDGARALPTPFLNIVTSFMNDPLENLSRSGDVVIEAENDHFLLSFALEVNNIRANYWWKEMKLKGTVTALIQQVRIEMKIKLMTDRNNSAPPELLVFNVERIEGIKVSVS